MAAKRKTETAAKKVNRTPCPGRRVTVYALRFLSSAELLLATLIYYRDHNRPFKFGSVSKLTAYSQFHLTWLDDILNL